MIQKEAWPKVFISEEAYCMPGSFSIECKCWRTPPLVKKSEENYCKTFCSTLDLHFLGHRSHPTKNAVAQAMPRQRQPLPRLTRVSILRGQNSRTWKKSFKPTNVTYIWLKFFFRLLRSKMRPLETKSPLHCLPIPASFLPEWKWWFQKWSPDGAPSWGGLQKPSVDLGCRRGRQIGHWHLACPFK